MSVPFWTPDFWAFCVGVALFAAFAYWCSNSERLSSFMFGAILIQYVVVMLAQSYKYNTHLIYNIMTGQLMSWGLGMIWISHIFGPAGGGAAGTWGAGGAVQAGYRFARTPLAKPAGVFIILTLLAALYAPTRVWYSSIETLIKFSSVALTYFAVVQFFHTRRRWNALLYTLLGITFICWLYGLLQYGGYDPLYKGNERTIFSFLGNKSFYGSWLSYTLPFAFYVSQTFGSPWRYLLLAFCATAGVFNMYIADTRSGWLAFGLFLILVPAFELWRGRFTSKLKDGAFWIKFAAVILVVAGAAWMLAPEHLKTKLETVTQTKKGTNAVRVFMWKGAVEMMLDSPLFGQGTGTFEQLFLHFRDDRFHRKGIQYGSRQAHSEPMEILADQGIVGISAWLAMIFALFYHGFGRLRREPDGRERILLFGLLAAMVCGIVNDAIQPTMRLLNHAMTFWILLALISRYLAGFEPEEEKRRLRVSGQLGAPGRRLALCAVLAAVFGALFMMNMRWMKSDKLYWRTGSAMNSHQYNNIAKRILELQPFSLRTLFGLTHYNSDFTASRIGEEAARQLCDLSPGQVLGHRNMYTGLMLRYQKTRDPATLFEALENLEYTAALDNSLDYHLPMAYYYREQNVPQRALYHVRFAVREVSDEYAEEILRHPSRIDLKPGERDTIFNELEGKGEFSYFPTRFVKGLNDFYRLRAALEAVLGYDEARDMYISFRATQRLTEENIWLRRALRFPGGQPLAFSTNRRLAYSISMLERAAVKARYWPDDQLQELFFEVGEMHKYLEKNPNDHVRIYLLGTLLLNLRHKEAGHILKVAATQAQASNSAPYLQARHRRLQAHLPELQ